MAEQRTPRTPSFRLDGRRALVTGGSSGIGFGAAAALAEFGASVTLIARDRARVDSAALAVREAGFQAEGVSLDLTEIDDVADFVERSGPYDILVGNAGRAEHADMLETDLASFDRVMGLNVRATYFCAQAVAKGLVAAGKPGSIITVSSQMGLVGGPKRTVYAATKHAVEGMTKSMALELAPHGIRANTLCPTFVRTELTRQTLEDEEMAAWVRRSIPMGRVAEVEDVMGAVVFLASDASRMVTGTSLLVDGGWTAQ